MTPLRLRALRCLVALAAPIGVAACADEESSEGAGVACEPAPEMTIAPKARVGGGWDANGSNLNGVLLRGGWDGNGSALTGVTVSGFAASPNEALVGTTLTGVLADGSTVDLVVAAYERDGERARYRIEHAGANVCPDGGTGIFVPGVWDETAARHDSLSVGGHTVATSFSCAPGAIAKCVAWGYDPWTVGAELHQACTRMARADYCGTGVSFTKDGTLIDVFDARGVQAPTADAELAFEAAWGPGGAVCARRTRFDDRSASGEKLLPSCWSALPSCGSLADARAFGAEIANASVPKLRTICR